jgi:NitT/TauT family transport system permease protein
MATRAAEPPAVLRVPAPGARPASRRRKFDRVSISGAVGLLVLVLVAWYIVSATTKIPTFVIPTPASVWRSLIGGFMHPLDSPAGWWLHIWVTLREAVVGLIAGSMLGLATGLLIAETRVLEGILMPHVIAIQCMPKAAIAPLLVIWFGFGSTSKTLLAFIMAFFPVLVNSIEGFSATDSGRLELVRSLNASRWQTFRLVRWPGALPFVYAGFQLAVVQSLLGAIIGELISGQAGMGVMLATMTGNFDTAGMFAALAILSVIGVVQYVILAVLRRRLLFWTDVTERSVV